MWPQEDLLGWPPPLCLFHSSLLRDIRDCIPGSFWSFWVNLGPRWAWCGRQVCLGCTWSRAAATSDVNDGWSQHRRSSCSSRGWASEADLHLPRPLGSNFPRLDDRGLLTCDLANGMSAVKAWWGCNRCAAEISQVNMATGQCFQVIPGVRQGLYQAQRDTASMASSYSPPGSDWNAAAVWWEGKSKLFEVNIFALTAAIRMTSAIWPCKMCIRAVSRSLAEW